MATSDKTILLIGDSFGIQRVYNGDCYVEAESTWPEQVKRQFSQYNILTDFRSYRRFVEIPQMIASQYSDSDIVILHAGIVDCYPRPLSSEITRSTKSRHRMVRRVVRKMRRFWLNYIYNKAWSSADDIEIACKQLAELGRSKQIVLVTPAPMPMEEYLNTPGVQEAIINFANRLRFLAQECDFAVIDVHKSFITTDFSCYLYPHDAHFNQAGNNWLAQEVVSYLNSTLTSPSAT